MKNYEELLKEWVDTFRPLDRMPIKAGVPLSYDECEQLCGAMDNRFDHLDEEINEIWVAIEDGNVVEIADGLADLVYVAIEMAVLLDIPFDAVFREVHRSNMTKLGADGQPIVVNGKVYKGPNYEPPNIEGVMKDGEK